MLFTRIRLQRFCAMEFSLLLPRRNVSVERSTGQGFHYSRVSTVSKRQVYACQKSTILQSTKIVVQISFESYHISQHDDQILDL
jgi:hypothetical protein